MLPPTTEEDALRLILNMRAYYNTAIEGFVEDDLFYEGLLEDILEVPEGFEITIPTTARAIIDEAVDNVEPYDMLIRYAPRSFGEQAQKEAENISRFIKNIWVYWRQTNSDIDILRDFIKNMFKHGKAIFKVVPDWSLWPELGEEEEVKLLEEGGKASVRKKVQQIKQLRKESFPLIARSMSPRHVYEDPTLDSRKLWVIEEYNISLSEIRNKYTEFVPELILPEPYSYTVKELWTATWIDWNGKIHEGMHWTFINETLMEKEPNIYYDVPYVIKHSGFGSESYDGKPEQKAVGFFTRQTKSMLKAEVRRVTHFDALMQQLAFPLILLPDMMEDVDFDTSPGSINYVPEEMLANAQNIFVTAKLPEPEYMTSINMIQNQIERATTQRAIRGAGVPGTDSAAQLSMITAQAKLRLEPVKRAVEEAVDMVNSMILKYIENILKDSVSIFGAEPDGPPEYTVKPEWIKGRFRTRTSFSPSEEQVKERKLVLATDAMTKAKLNPYDALTFAGWENPMEVIKRNLAYSILLEDPSVRRQIAKEALKDWGMDTMELQLEELNDTNMLKQMAAMLQQKNQGTPGAGAPGQDLQQQGSPAPGGQQQAQVPAAPPQAAGSPLAQPQQMPEVNGAMRDIGQMQQ
jgi:hypothetical protein